MMTCKHSDINGRCLWFDGENSFGLCCSSSGFCVVQDMPERFCKAYEIELKDVSEKEKSSS